MAHVDDGLASGDTLRRERLRRRLTLAQVSQATRVRERYLEAIENGDASDLPGPVYTTGFIQIYARFLGLDPEPFVRAYRSHLGTTPAAQVRPEVTRGSYTSRRRPTLVVPGVTVLLLAVLIGYLYQQVAAYVSSGTVATPLVGARVTLAIPTPLPSPPPPPSPTPTALPPSPTAVPTAPVVQPTATPPPSASPTSAPTNSLRVEAEISGRVWLQVESDGKVVFSGILLPGDKRSWSATKTMMLWSGNAGLVQVTLNGRQIGALGPSGKVMKVTWNTPSAEAAAQPRPDQRPPIG